MESSAAMERKSGVASSDTSYTTARTGLSTNLSFITARSSASVSIIRAPVSIHQASYDQKPESEYRRNLVERRLISSEIVEKNWAGRPAGKGQHVEFDLTEKVPLDVLGLLGCSNVAQVHKVRCRRILLARKSMKCTYKLRVGDALNEVEQLQKLRHPHIIQLVGSYVQGRTFAILLYPVASYDLEAFMDRVTLILASDAAGLDTLEVQDYLAILSLTKFISCLSNALKYIHSMALKHMDIKPKNILVKQHARYTYGHQVYIADFGISRSFSPEDHSQTESYTAKTPMYCAPEVYEGRCWGRAADVFSMGCVFLEIQTVLCGKTLDEFVEYRRTADSESFHANLDRVFSWLDLLRNTMPYFELNDDSYLTEANDNVNAALAEMLERLPGERPTAEFLVARLGMNRCCRKEPENHDTEESSSSGPNCLGVPKKLQSPISDFLPVGHAMDYVVRQAASNGREYLLQLLLVNGCDVEAIDNHNRTALHWAALKGHLKSVSQLVDAGANVNAKRTDGQTALHHASFHEQGAIVQLLIDSGAGTGIQDRQGRTALHFASFQERGAIVQLLIDSGAGKDIQDHLGQTALHCACSHGREAIVQLLIDSGAGKDIQDRQGQTALHFASSQEGGAIVQLLIDSGAGKDIQDHLGQTALHCACSHGREEIVQLLIDSGAGKDIQDHLGRAALHIASSHGREAIVQLLINSGAGKDIQDHLGETALHHASFHGRGGIVQLLINKGARKDIRDLRERTALHIARAQGRREIVQLLIDNGAGKECSGPPRTDGPPSLTA